MAVSTRRMVDPHYVAQHLSPLMRAEVTGARWYKATYFRIDPLLRRTCWALRNRGIARWDPALACEVLTAFGEQVRLVIRGERGL